MQRNVTLDLFGPKGPHSRQRRQQAPLRLHIVVCELRLQVTRTIIYVIAEVDSFTASEKSSKATLSCWQ